jgi:hypothetical protein
MILEGLTNMPRLAAFSLCCLLILGLVSAACGVSTPAAPTAVPGLLADYPLKPGNTWTYLVGRYNGFNPSEIATSTFVMTETVAAVTTISSYYVATIRQDVSSEFAIYIPETMQDLPHGAPTPEQYWLIVDGNRLYRQWPELDLSNPQQKGALDFVFPLQVGTKWYQSDEMAKLNPDYANGSMLHEVVKADEVIVPAGKFENCYLVTEAIGGDNLEDWFCPGIGYVDRKDDHGGTPFGYRQVLIGYHLEP